MQTADLGAASSLLDLDTGGGELLGGPAGRQRQLRGPERRPGRGPDGAVVFYLRRVPWQIRDFDVDRYDRALRALHERIQAKGEFTVHNHRFLIEAEMPPRP